MGHGDQGNIFDISVQQISNPSPIGVSSNGVSPNDLFICPMISGWGEVKGHFTVLIRFQCLLLDWNALLALRRVWIGLADRSW